jgi:hypothetical protein
MIELARAFATRCDPLGLDVLVLAALTGGLAAKAARRDGAPRRAPRRARLRPDYWDYRLPPLGRTS